MERRCVGRLSLSRTAELAVHIDDVAGLRWPSVALTDASPDPVRVAVPVRGLDGPVDLPLDGRAAARLQSLLRVRRFWFRALLPVYCVVNVAFTAGQVLTDLARTQFGSRVGWVVFGFNVVVLGVAVVGALRYRVRQLPRMRGYVLVVPAVHPAVAQAMQELNRPGIITVR
jgi:hypothetical protein